MKKVLTSAIVGLILLVAPWFLRMAPAPLSSYGAIAVAYLIVCLVVSWARFELKDFEQRVSGCIQLQASPRLGWRQLQGLPCLPWSAL